MIMSRSADLHNASGAVMERGVNDWLSEMKNIKLHLRGEISDYIFKKYEIIFVKTWNCTNCCLLNEANEMAFMGNIWVHLLQIWNHISGNLKSCLFYCSKRQILHLWDIRSHSFCFSSFWAHAFLFH